MNLSKVLFHPIFVHFPIALCFFEFFLLSLAGLKKNKEYLVFSRLTFRVLTACLVLTVAAGYRDAGGTIADLFEGGVEKHFYAACVFTSLVLVRHFLWRRFNLDHPKCFVVQMAGSLLMMVAAAVTAHWGGELVYS